MRRTLLVVWGGGGGCGGAAVELSMFWPLFGRVNKAEARRHAPEPPRAVAVLLAVAVAVAVAVGTGAHHLNAKLASRARHLQQEASSTRVRTERPSRRDLSLLFVTWPRDTAFVSPTRLLQEARPRASIQTAQTWALFHHSRKANVQRHSLLVKCR
jgi:hypothetical protein